MQLTFMTYNIKSGLWTPEGIDALARVIGGVNPDVVALQEVDRNMPRSDNVDQAAVLGERLGLHAVFCKATGGENFGLPGGEFGNAVLARRPIVEHECRFLYRPGYPPDEPPPYYAEQRAVLGCAVDLGGTLLDVCCTHFGLTQDQRLIQAQEVADFCTGWHPGRPVVLMGDFNAFPDTPEIATLRGSLTDLFQQRSIGGDERLTFPSGPLGSRAENGWSGAIDYVFLSAHFHSAEIEVIREDTPASDHAPVVARVELQGG